MPRESPLIAVVNDDTTFLSLMHDLLTDEGYQVVLHIEGATAYQLIKQEMPDLVILDIRIEHPESGWVTLDLIRLDPATTRIPVLVCSADARQLREKADRLKQMRCDVIEKPFDLDDLLASVHASLAAAQQPDDM
jgi:CheY-like chemotaxis protein